jgi:TRAP-type mannitol/chloroaromatic compound transport system substrate-binding protein
MFDALRVFVKSSMGDKNWPATKSALKGIEQAGGEVRPFTDQMRAALRERNEEILAEVAASDAVADGEAFVARARAAADRWSQSLDELGYDKDVDYADFTDWYEPDKVDLEPYLEKLFGEVLLPHRPS